MHAWCPPYTLRNTRIPVSMHASLFLPPPANDEDNSVTWVDHRNWKHKDQKTVCEGKSPYHQLHLHHSPAIARAYTHTHNTQIHTCLLVCLAVRCPSFEYFVRTRRHVIQSVTADDHAHRVLRPAGTLALTCTCPPGSRGTIKAATTAPFYTGRCVGMYVAMCLCMCGGVVICGVVVCILA